MGWVWALEGCNLSDPACQNSSTFFVCHLVFCASVYYRWACFLFTAANKPVLIASGLVDVIFSLLTNQSPFVQFKLLGTLRMLTMGQGVLSNSNALYSHLLCQAKIILWQYFLFVFTADVVTSICSRREQLVSVVECAESSGHEGVRGEATRLLALVVKHALDSGN